jgi:hypothetical protein
MTSGLIVPACFTLPHALFCVYAPTPESAIVRHG